MKKITSFFAALLLLAAHTNAQTEPAAGTWPTWFIPSGKDYRLPAPAANKAELQAVIQAQKSLDSNMLRQIQHWAKGTPAYHWQRLMSDVWMSEALKNGFMANLLLHVTTYDALVATWDSKYAHGRKRPFEASKKVRAIGINPQSPSYPCEYSVAAGVAVAIIGKFIPKLADSVQHMAERVMAARVAAGMAYPSDTQAGFELGKRIAAAEIERTKGYFNNKPLEGKMPDKPGLWRGPFAMLPNGGLSKTIVLEKGSQFRPGPPPDFAADMAELKKHKNNMDMMGNALRFATQSVWENILDQKIFEYNLHLNPPRAARLYALSAIGQYDCFVACWDAKYTYWGIRPSQYDTTYKSLLPNPPFPGYPSGHAAISGTMSELYSYFFPAERAYFQQEAVLAAESRFQAGIHFRTDNDVALVLGRQVAGEIIKKVGITNNE